jgi:hypothetical protein
MFTGSKEHTAVGKSFPALEDSRVSGYKSQKRMKNPISNSQIGIAGNATI